MMKATLLAYAYSFVIALSLPFAVLRLLWKSRKNPDYRQRIGERLALKLPDSHGAIWIHSVSVGEFLAVLPLIEQLLEQKKALLITTTTPTGSAMLKAKLGRRVKHCYLPFDLPIFTRRFVQQTRPQAAVFVETEIWPNFIHSLNKQDIPAYLINARLSEKSYRGYAVFGAFTQQVLGGFREVACQNNASCQRFQQLGANASMLGNLKFDINPPADLTTQQTRLKTYLRQRPFILAASTHKGEEELILSRFKHSAFVDSHLLVIAPRHPERSDAIIELARAQNLSIGRYSQTTVLAPDSDVLIIDTLGQLLAFYSLAEWAIIGGSFIPHGGHNPLEAALFATPCVIGKHYFNFATLIDEMQHDKAIVVIDQQQLFNSIPAAGIGSRAKRFLTANQGAVHRYQQLIIGQTHD
ncbi:MAG: 3-deoxy-D-manno-octulosonic acid transferase [Gammaproteobacteria bacterium]|nr:MAG: 3-deoxy-D-manno-octulosonic acid transferase [Gammaproteobacteria bacterium]